MYYERMMELSGKIIRRERLSGLEPNNPPICTLVVLEEYSREKISETLIKEYLRLYNRAENGEDVGSGYPELIERIFNSLRIDVSDIRVDRKREMNKILSGVKNDNIGLVIETMSDHHVVGVRRGNLEDRFCLYGIVQENMRGVQFFREGIFNLLYKEGLESNVSIVTRKKG